MRWWFSQYLFMVCYFVVVPIDCVGVILVTIPMVYLVVGCVTFLGHSLSDFIFIFHFACSWCSPLWVLLEVSMLHLAIQCNICIFDLRDKILKNPKTLSNVQTLIEVEVKCPQQTSTYNFGFLVTKHIPKQTYFSKKNENDCAHQVMNSNSFDTKVSKVT